VGGEIKVGVAERLLEAGEEEAGGGIALVLSGMVGVEVALALSLADLPALSLRVDPSHDVDQVTTELALYWSTARLHNSIALQVLGYTALASVISSIRRIQGAVAKQDTGASKRFPQGIISVIVGDVATVLLSLASQPAFLQAGHIVDDVQDVVLKHTVLQINRALCKHSSLALLCPSKSEDEY